VASGTFTTSKNGVFNVLKVPARAPALVCSSFGVGLDVKIWAVAKVSWRSADFYSGVPDLNVVQGRTRMHNFIGGGGVVWMF